MCLGSFLLFVVTCANGEGRERLPGPLVAARKLAPECQRMSALPPKADIRNHLRAQQPRAACCLLRTCYALQSNSPPLCAQWVGSCLAQSFKPRFIEEAFRGLTAPDQKIQSERGVCLAVAK